MDAHVTSVTDYGEGRLLVQIKGRSRWSAYLRQTPNGWRVWLHEGGMSALSEDEAVAWAGRVMDALEPPAAGEAAV